MACVQCRLIYLSNLVINLIRDLGEVFSPQFASRYPLVKKNPKTKKPTKLFESSVSGWVHILAGSWFIYCVWPGWLLELWRYSECCRKSAGENVRHSAGLRQMQVQDYTGICAGFSGDEAVFAPALLTWGCCSLSPLLFPFETVLCQVCWEQEKVCFAWLLSILTQRRLIFAPTFFWKRRTLDYPLSS